MTIDRRKVVLAVTEQWDDRTLDLVLNPDEVALAKKLLHNAGRAIGPIDITHLSTTELTLEATDIVQTDTNSE